MTMRRTHIQAKDTAKRERLEARVSAEQKALLQRAADLQGRTLSDFIIGSAQQAAEEIIREHMVITLTAQDSRAFVEALLNPPAPNERLRAAAARYTQESVET
jgi:uncharacterized protein (DUF1778 family)